MKKFVDIKSARGLEFGRPVFVKDDSGVFHMAILRKKEDVGKGIEHTFELAAFSADWDGDNTPILVKNITHVCIPK